jgi:tRNA(Ile)-lysidine synthase
MGPVTMPGLFFCRVGMLDEFENEVLKFSRAEQLFGDEDRLLLGVSGGPDSTALMNAFWSLRAEGLIKSELLCAHLNHRLRGAESEADEEFVVSEANGLGINIVTRRLDVNRYASAYKLSIETAARKWRIETLSEIAKQNGCTCIATGHHKNDNAETIIQRLMRGTGFRGLAGIHPRRKFEEGIYFIRPLLCFTEERIKQYLRGRNLGWREDSSNLNTEFRRNFIRHYLLPEIQKDCNEPIIEQLWRLSCRMRRFQQYLERQVEPQWNKLVKLSAGKVSIDLPAFQLLPEPIKVELVRRTLSVLGSGEGNLTEGHFERVIELSNQNISNRMLELPDGFTAWREYKKLIFSAPRQDDSGEWISVGPAVEIKIPGLTQFVNRVIEADVREYNRDDFEKFKIQKSDFVEWFDYDELALPLTVRFRSDGDRFVPLGMENEKKVGQLLTDAQVPQDIRDKVLIISDACKIIWVWPIRISEQVKVSQKTRKVLELHVKQSS